MMLHDMQSQCLESTARYARACLLQRDNPSSVSTRDVRARKELQSGCTRGVLKRYTYKCQPLVMKFQAAIGREAQASAADREAATNDRQALTIRLTWCTSLKKVSMQAKPVPWYFKNADGTPFAPHLEEADEEAKKH